MKLIQNALLLVTILIALNCSKSFGQNAQSKRQHSGVSKESSLSGTSRNLIMHHLSSFQDNDLKTLMTDYTDKSVLVTQTATYTGLKEIEGFFAGLIPQFPKPMSKFELDKLIVNNEFVYIVWHAKTPSLDVPLGSDTFIMKDGKIYYQTFAGEMNFIK